MKSIQQMTLIASLALASCAGPQTTKEFYEMGLKYPTLQQETFTVNNTSLDVAKARLTNLGKTCFDAAKTSGFTSFGSNSGSPEVYILKKKYSIEESPGQLLFSLVQERAGSTDRIFVNVSEITQVNAKDIQVRTFSQVRDQSPRELVKSGLESDTPPKCPKP